jgi:lipoprotein NlpD
MTSILAIARALVAAAFAVALASCGSSPRAPVVERSASRPAPGRIAQTPAPSPAAPAPPPSAGAPVAELPGEGLYVVKRGDTLYSIALEHGADYRELAQWNGLDDPARIQVGQTLRVRPPEGRSVQIGRPTIIGRIESRPLETGGGLPAETPKLEPRATPAPEPAKSDPPKSDTKAATAPPPGPLEFTWPVKGKVISSFSEPRSKGIDIDGKLGEPVLAAAPGRVTYIGSGIPGLGKLVVIKHDNGFITVYAHNRAILVKEQQSVVRGQKIAELGASDSDRPKLHFQIRKGAAAVDPLRYLPAL